jgi:hypothetical protein
MGKLSSVLKPNKLFGDIKKPWNVLKSSDTHMVMAAVTPVLTLLRRH